MADSERGIRKFIRKTLLSLRSRRLESLQTQDRSIPVTPGTHEFFLQFAAMPIMTDPLTDSHISVIQDKGCKDGTCVEVVYDTRPRGQQTGTFLQAHIRTNDTLPVELHAPVSYINTVDNDGAEFGSHADIAATLDHIRMLLSDENFKGRLVDQTTWIMSKAQRKE